MAGSRQRVDGRLAVATMATIAMLGSPAAGAEKRWVDVGRSHVTIYLSGPDASRTDAHGYVLKAPLAEGSLDDTATPHLALVINVDQLVVDPRRSEQEREQAHRRILGPDGLDAERFSRITYHSLSIAPEDDDIWFVKGELELHGRFLPLDLKTVRQGDRFTGVATVSPAAFGVLPLHLPGVTTPVGHEVRVEFDVVLEPR